MTNTVSFIVQVQNETDGDRCRYALVSIDEGILRGREEIVSSMNGIDPHFEGAVFSGGFVAHFLDASFPVSPDDEFPEGQEPFLSIDESTSFDAEGWASVPPSLVESATSAMSGFLDDVQDPRLFVTPLGIQVLASWSLDDGDALVRSWSVPWDVLPAKAGE
jgi:hypothetical protein